jgi:mono/diheme cytochrome c family protein
MSDAKTPKVLFLLLIVALAGALVVSGCGGGGSSSSSNTEEAAEEKSEEGAGGTSEAEGEAEEESAGGEEEAGEEAGNEMTEKEARSGAGSLSEEGAEVFATNCGSCHTLKAAGTTGEVGPNLDELEPDLATVEHQVVNGGGGMPAFGETLNAKEIKAVATYVSSVAGQG